ncbi:hypothetical protein QN277_008583 [Acacia crassicarpa]|uniref:Uncharacterized protein n=1 Tax=Acacia crassicarpa TaxID=499986 RepID=A0AAE1JM24_9FABA|nr:hypothetical protein QN277_008583 [Acacia crassicarpa]
MEEEKQLDFNQPFLSVRRYSPKVASEIEKKSKTRGNSLIRLLPLPDYKSDLKSGPVSHPGTVPFIWEHTPGRPKNEGKLPKLDVKQPPLTPNLPPGRASRIVKHQDSDQVSKGSSISSKSATKQKILKELVQENDSYDSDDGDETYQDALDTLSTAESYSMNCSASGLSVLDDQEETQPFGSFSSSDQRARDFMISRFLPAAKAIASESPQPLYTSRKPPVAQEEPQEVVLISKQRYSPLRQIVLSQYAQDYCEDEDGYEIDGSENNATKVCGIFPRFCFLNPLPELKMEGRVLSSAATHNGTRKEYARNSHREKKSVYSQFGFREEKVRTGSSKLSARESTEFDFGCAIPVVEKTLYVDSVHEVKSHSIEGRSSESLLDLPFTSYPDRSIDDIHMHITNHSNKIELTKPLEHEINNLDKNLWISSPKVAQCKKVLSDNSVMSNQENFDGTIQNPAYSTVQECSKGVSNGKTDLETQGQKRQGNQEAINLRVPLSLPSPKAPSESWLKRTLTTISSSNVTAKIPAPSRIAKYYSNNT